MEEKRTTDDEISLVDILRVLWKYKYFIIISCIIGLLISFVILYTLNFNTKNQNTNSFNYRFKIYLKSISYEFYNNFKLNLNYDYNTGYIKNNFGIISYKLFSNEIKRENYDKTNFPIGSIFIDVIFEKDLNEETNKKFCDYIKDLLFKASVLDNIEDLKIKGSNIISSNNININSNNIYLTVFLTLISQDISSLFNLKYTDINRNYELVKNYFLNFNKTNLNQDLSLSINFLMSIIDKQYQFINNLNINYEKIINSNILIIKDILKKEIIIFLALFLFSIFLVFVIDFFKKYGKEIVK